MRGLICAALLTSCVALAGCGKSDNGTGTHGEDGREIAKTGTFEGQTTYGQVGTVDQAASDEPATNNTAP